MSLRAVLAAATMIAVACPLRAQVSQPDAPAGPGNAALPDETLPVPPVSPRIAEGDQYEHCMDMLAEDPEGAEAFATGWKAGGEGATHCHALAQVELGNPAAGAQLLTDLAAHSTAPAASRAEVFGEAAEAWTMAGNTESAYAAASQGVALSPEDADLRVTHAIAAIATHRAREAEEDLTIALEADPKRADALVLRATARRALGRLAEAQADIAAALAADPDNPDALLERGIIRQRAGDRDGARADWQRVADLAPDSATGDLAEQNLALLDAGPRQ